jgi:CRISPR-associated protein Csd1
MPPVGERAVFAYTTGLNHLTRPESEQKYLIGDTTVLVWAERATSAESVFCSLLSGMSEESPAKGLEALEAAEASAEVEPDKATKRIGDRLKRIAAGQWADDPELGPAGGVRFFVMGLAPNVSRLQVRFFEVDTLGRLLERIQIHCRDVMFETPETARRVPSLSFLARETLPKDSEGRPRSDESAGKSVQRLFADLLRGVLSATAIRNPCCPSCSIVCAAIAG